MARPPNGSVVEREGVRGRVYALRFRAYGRREYVTTDCRTRADAEVELRHTLADVERGIWKPSRREVVEARQEEQTFHEFASAWLAARKQEGLRPRTIEDYEWALTHHLLPWFADFRLNEITKRDVDEYKVHKAAEGVLGHNQINKTLTRLSQVLALAEEYELIAGNPATGKRRRLPRTRPRRGWVRPEQLMSLLEAAEDFLGGRGRPLLATMAGAGGLRVGELTSLQRRQINIPRASLELEQAKTEAGVRVVDLTPALRDELAVWLDRSPHKGPTDLVFPTLSGKPDNRNNVKRFLTKTVQRANKRLAELGLDPIEHVTPHGLRRTYASLRHAVGDDVAYTSAQLGHESPDFTLRVYVQETKRRERLTDAERREYDRALEWAEMGTNDVIPLPAVASNENGSRRQAAADGESSEWSVPGSNR
jgi:integrase